MKTMFAAASIIRTNPMVRTILAGPLALRRRYLAARGRARQELFSRISGLIVGDVTLKVDEFDGEFEISPKSHLFRRVISDGHYESAVCNCFNQYLKADRDVLDIGANVGFFTVGAARKLKSGKVLSVEPSQSAFERLSRNVMRNEVGDRVILIQSAMSDRSEARFLSVIPGMEEYSSFSVNAHADKSPSAIRISENVMTTTVDEMVDKYNLNPAVMKVDVEGAEDLVFSGALKTLRRFHPVVFAELSPELLSKMGADAAQVVKRFTDLGYSGFDPERPGAPIVRPEGANVVFVPGR